MPYSDPDRDNQIAELRRQRDDAEERYRETHKLWRDGLHAAQAGESAAAIEAALSGY